jgi:uncharacterized protein YutE (UPF0331/DUF86 family)
MKNFDDIILNKTESIRRCVERAREEYVADQSNFLKNFSRQDAAMMNIQRGCEQAIDLANHVVRLLKIGAPTNAKDSFDLLVTSKIIDNDLANKMCRMIGFRNNVVHEYQKINFDIVVAILEKNADDLLEFGESIRRQSKRLNMLSDVVGVEFDDEKKTEEQFIGLIEKFYNFYRSSEDFSSDLINAWRRSMLKKAISAIGEKGAPKMFRLCATSLRLFCESEDKISPDVLRSSFNTEKEEDLEQDIAILKKRI